MTQIGAVLLEILGNVSDYKVSIDLAVSLEFTEVDQLWQRGIGLVFLYFVDLSLHLDSVAVIVIHYREILLVGNKLFVFKILPIAQRCLADYTLAHAVLTHLSD